MTRTPAAAVMATVIAIAGEAPARAEPLPSWLTIADTHRAPVHVIPPVAAARLAVLHAEGHPAIDRYRHTTYNLRADGVVEERLVVARQFLTDEGVREAGTLAFPASASTDRVTIDEAYVLMPDGRRRPFDARTVQVVAQGRDGLFHDFHSVALPFAGLAPGATAVVVARIISDSRRWPLPWSEIHQTQAGWPIEHLEIDLHWAPGMPAPAWRTDDGTLRCQTDAGQRQLRCVRDAIPALAGDPDVASWSDLMPQLVLSTGTSWFDLQAIERKLLAPAEHDPTVQQVADRLMADADSSDELIEVLLRFVADEVRYVGFEHGPGAVTPRSPSLTLARRFGDCKDKVALFLALAGRAGLQAYPVLVATGSREPRKLILPSWKYFDHVIACVRREIRGQPVCLDPTQSDLPAGTLPVQVRDAVILALDGGAREPAALPRPDGPAGWTWQAEIESRNEVACDGTIKETLVRRYLGPSAGKLRGVVRASTADERQRWMERLYAEVMGEKIKPAFSIEGTDAPGLPLELRSVAQYPATVRLDEIFEWTDRDPWLASIGRKFKTGNRRHPYAMGGLSVNSDTIYELSCATVQPRLMGAELALKTEFGALRRHYHREARRVVVKTTLRLPPQTVAADQLERFNRFVDSVLDQTGIWYSLEHPSAPPGRGTP